MRCRSLHLPPRVRLGRVRPLPVDWDDRILCNTSVDDENKAEAESEEGRECIPLLLLADPTSATLMSPTMIVAMNRQQVDPPRP